MKARIVLAGTIVVGCLLITLGCIFLYIRNKDVPYVPILKGDLRSRQLFVEEQSLATNDHLRAVYIVLQDYGYSCYFEGSILYVPRELQADKDLMQNITAKAEQMRLEEGVQNKLP